MGGGAHPRMRSTRGANKQTNKHTNKQTNKHIHILRVYLSTFQTPQIQSADRNIRRRRLYERSLQICPRVNGNIYTHTHTHTHTHTQCGMMMVALGNIRLDYGHRNALIMICRRRSSQVRQKTLNVKFPGVASDCLTHARAPARARTEALFTP